jgi:hypothetical protein
MNSPRLLHDLANSFWALAIGVLLVYAVPRATAGEKLHIGISVEFENPSLVKESLIAFRFLLGEALSDQDLETELHQYSTYNEGLEAVRTRQIDVTVAPGQALAMLPKEEQALFVPEIVIQRHEGISERFQLLSRKGTNLDDLRGSRLRIVDRRNRGITGFWLDAELRAVKQSTSGEFFSSIRDCLEPQDAVLPTFFGNADACLVSETDFQLLNELNPQLGKSLSVVLTSPPLIPLVLARHRDNHSPGLQVLFERATHVHERPDGRQIFTLVQLSRLGRFREEDFAGTRELAALSQRRRDS